MRMKSVLNLKSSVLARIINYRTFQWDVMLCMTIRGTVYINACVMYCNMYGALTEELFNDFFNLPIIY